MESTATLPRCTPESQGIAAQAILGFVEEAEKKIHELHSFMLLRHGAVVAEGWWSPYGPELSHMLYSLSKSFTSSAIGLAVAEGRLTVNDPVVSFFPEDAPAEISDNLQAMRVKQLLSMSTGHAEDTTDRLTQQPDPNWVKVFLSLPVEYRPGTHFVYNSGASYMLSAIVQKVTGQTVLEYLQPRLFEPLGIQGATWETSPQGINMGGWGLNLKTEHIARFGQMYLQKGKWNGRQVLPESWVTEATTRQVSNGSSPDSDWEQGYCYQFWRCRHGAYRGDGAFGQYCIVMPEQDAVLAITSGVADMQQVLNVVWECLLPEMTPSPLVANAQTQEALQQKLNTLAIPPLAGQPVSPLAASVSGKVFSLADNELNIESLSFDFTDDACTLTINGANQPDAPSVHRLMPVFGKQQLTCSSGAWRMAETALFTGHPQRCDASGAWTAPDTYTLLIRLVQTPFYFTLACQFSGEQVEIQLQQNVGFDLQKFPVLVGKT